MTPVFLTALFLALSGPFAAADETPDLLLMALEPPPPSREHFAAYAEAGLNLVTLSAGAKFTEEAALAAEAGLSVLLANPAAMDGGLAADLDRMESGPAIAGWILGTNVTMADRDALEAQLERLQRLDSHQIALTFASMDDADAAASADRLLDAGVNAFGLRAFTLKRDGSKARADYFGYLACARELARKHRARWVGFVQVTEAGDFRFASESDLRFQVYSQLAFGARGLAYHRYWLTISHELWQANPSAGMRASMVNPFTGERHYTWRNVAEVNREVSALWPVLRELQVSDVFFVGDVPSGMCPFPFGKLPIRSVIAQSALLSCLRDGDGRDWAFVVNGVHGMQRSAQATERTLRLQLDPAVGEVMEVERTTGALKSVGIERNELYLTLPGGTGALLLLTPREAAAPSDLPAHPESAQ